MLCMLRLPCVLLHHVTRIGSHYDWLLADPTHPDGRLWAARTRHPSRDWLSLRTWDLALIAPHRRDYLTYQGPISAGRGSVTRVDRGRFIARHWSRSRIIIDIATEKIIAGIQILRITEKHWRAAIVGAVAAMSDDEG